MVAETGWTARPRGAVLLVSTLVASWMMTAPLAAQQGLSDDPYLLTQSGIASLGAQRYEAALGYFDEALLRNPGYLEAQAGKARALAGIGKFTEALAITSRLSTLEPKFKLDDATILLLVKRPERALQQIDAAALAIRGSDELSVAMTKNGEFYQRVHYLRGEAYYMMQGYEQAGAAFALARSLGAGSPAIRGIGDAYVAIDDLGAAKKAYDDALAHRRHDGLAYHRRARVRFLLGDLEGALEDFGEAEVYLDNSREFLAQYAEALIAADNYSKAAIVLNRLLRVARGDPDYQRIVRYHLATTLIDADRPRDAEIELSAIEDWSEIAVERHFQRGRARFAMRDFTGAIRYFDSALALRRGDPKLLYNRGIAWLRLNEVEKALNDLSNAAVRDPSNATIRDAIGRIRLSRGEYQEALAFYDAAVKAHPSEVQPLIQRANAYLSTGDAAGALKDAERALDIEPRNMDAAAAAASALLALDRPAESLDYAERLVGSVSRQKEGYVLTARAALAQGQPEQALANIEQARNHGAAPSRLAMLTGDAYALADRYDEALGFYERGVRLTGGAPSAIIKRGDAYKELGDSQRAAKDYTAALETYPRSYSLYLKRGQSFKALGECASATADFDRALAIRPGDNTAIRERGKCSISSGRLISGFRDLFRSLI